MRLENIDLPHSAPRKAPESATASTPQPVMPVAPEPEAELDVEMTMSVSPVCVKDGKQYAFVSFQMGDKMAEGKIPECKIVSNKGFSSEEVNNLQLYMKRELTSLKKMASSVNVLGAFMK